MTRPEKYICHIDNKKFEHKLTKCSTCKKYTCETHKWSGQCFKCIEGEST